MDDDKLIAQALKLWFDYYKDDKRIMEENKFGILNKEFVKKHLQRETELENKIDELENKLKSINNTSNIVNEFTDDMCHSLLTRIAMHMSVEMHNSDNYYGLGGTPVGTYSYLITPIISVNSVPISEQEFIYLQSLVKPSKLECYNIEDNMNNKIQIHEWP